MLFFLALVLDFFLAASGALVPDRVSRIKESIDAPPAGWTRIDRAPPHLSVRLRIALMQGQFDELERRLYEISDPDHARYGAHMTKQDVESLVRPRSTTLALVDEWLATFGFNTTTLDRSPAEDWVTLTVPVLILEQMLDTEYFIWRHDDGELLARTTSYSLPGYLHEHVELIQPTTMFARSPKRVARPAEDKHAVDSDCGTMITLACLRQLYSADGYTPRAPKKNAIGITGFLDQYANHKDLASFYRDQLPEAEGSSFRFVSVNGGANNQSLSAAGEEANLDVQYALGLAYPTPGTFWSTAGNGPFHPDARVHDPDNEPYMTWLDHVLRSDRLPQTITTSYADDEQTVPSAYARRVCKRFAELGASAVSPPGRINTRTHGRLSRCLGDICERRLRCRGRRS
ncbi:unnamed protein product [Mycena citricolor]|uniref:Peptidase S53 activation domain-containing protein n=1 Tax=Mycena citricolor TaxID=2018698 RepID=A0AAD2GVN2_9AGAR|nr:unnamed protein product [Mycena citricolor]